MSFCLPGIPTFISVFPVLLVFHAKAGMLVFTSRSNCSSVTRIVMAVVWIILQDCNTSDVPFVVHQVCM
jgi:hypothetical protein